MPLDWRLDCIVLRTTTRTCSCGAASRHCEPFLFYSAPDPSKTSPRGRRVHRFEPLTGSTHPTHLPIVRVERQVRAPLCYKCVDLKVGQPLPPINESTWLAKLAREEEAAAAPKPRPAVSFTTRDIERAFQ